MVSLLSLVLKENAEAATYAYGRFKYGWAGRSTNIMGTATTTASIICADDSLCNTLYNAWRVLQLPTVDSHLCALLCVLLILLLILFYFFFFLDRRDSNLTSSNMNTFHQLNMLVTNLALGQVEGILKVANDREGLDYLSGAVRQMLDKFLAPDLM